jgi:hypothetical protein
MFGIPNKDFLPHEPCEHDLTTVRGLVEARSDDGCLLKYVDLKELADDIDKSEEPVWGKIASFQKSAIVELLRKEYPRIEGTNQHSRCSDAQVLMELHRMGLTAYDLNGYFPPRIPSPPQSPRPMAPKHELLDESLSLTIYYSPAHMSLDLPARIKLVKHLTECDVMVTIGVADDITDDTTDNTTADTTDSTADSTTNSTTDDTVESTADNTIDSTTYQFKVDLSDPMVNTMIEWILNYDNNNQGNRPKQTYALYVLNFLIKMHAVEGTEPFPVHFEQASYTIQKCLDDETKYQSLYVDKPDWYTLPIEVESDIDSDLRDLSQIDHYVHFNQRFEPGLTVYCGHRNYGSYLQYEIISHTDDFLIPRGRSVGNIISDNPFSRALLQFLFTDASSYLKTQAIECLSRMWD